MKTKKKQKQKKGMKSIVRCSGEFTPTPAIIEAVKAYTELMPWLELEEACSHALFG